MSLRLVCIYPWMAMGGADKINIDMITQLRQHGWQTTVITTLTHPHPWRDLFAACAEQIITIGELDPQQQPHALLEAVVAQNPDLVLISNSALGYRLLPALRARLPHVAIADCNHVIDNDMTNGGYPYESAIRSALFDLQITTSEALRHWMIACGAPAEQIAVLMTNVDTDQLNPQHYNRAALRQHFGIPEDAFVGLYAARFEALKQPVLAAELMRVTIQQAPGSYFFLAGDGSYTPFLRSFIRAHRLERQMLLLGPVPNRQIPELLAASDVLLLPSRMEGVSVAVYEAMAMAVVPLSVDVFGQAELVTPACGILVKPDEHQREAYQQGLIFLASNRIQRERMRAASRSRVAEQFAIAQMGDRLDGLLRKAIAKRSGMHGRGLLPGEAEIAASIAEGIAGAEADARWTRVAQRPATKLAQLRKAIRRQYWALVERGAWWIVPIVDRVIPPVMALLRTIRQAANKRLRV